MELFILFFFFYIIIGYFAHEPFTLLKLSYARFADWRVAVYEYNNRVRWLNFPVEGIGPRGQIPPSYLFLYVDKWMLQC